ncbi:MAG: hypothetical protein UHD09_08795 [Bifidobacterium sp.]|nr:hypothetical protein [Bifidobacterium sp.]
MAIEIRNIEPRDFPRAVEFAMVGMHFDWYVRNRTLRTIYTWHFWYDELSKATQILGAYDGDRFLGVLLARIDGERTHRLKWGPRAFTRVMDWLLDFGEVEGEYDRANREMLAAYRRDHHPDGEILFLAADRTAASRASAARSWRSSRAANPARRCTCTPTAAARGSSTRAAASRASANARSR